MEQQLREKICQIGELMHRFQLIEGASGNISARLDQERLLVTPSGVSKGFLRPEHLLVVDMEGKNLTSDVKPTSEILMHLEVYRQRSDVHGVVHAHPPYAVALSIAGISLQTYNIPEALIMHGDIPVTPYATPSSAENRQAIAELISCYDSIMLAYHGSLTVGSDVWMAYLRLESLEHIAKITFLTHQLGGGSALPPDQLQKLFVLRQQFGFAHASESFCEQCGMAHPADMHREK